MDMSKTLILLSLILMPTIAFADCWSIKDYDLQRKCLAEANNDSSYCWQIKDYDSQRECLAKQKKDKSYCWQIKNNDRKQLCLETFK